MTQQEIQLKLILGSLTPQTMVSVAPLRYFPWSAAGIRALGSSPSSCSNLLVTLFCVTLAALLAGTAIKWGTAWG